MRCVRLSLLLPAIVLFAGGESRALAADVVLNEFAASTSDRVLHHPAGRHPQAGLATPWIEPAFNDQSWDVAPGAFGFGSFTGVTITTDTSAAMQGRVPSLYLRHTFAVTNPQAASNANVRLIVRANDGFIAFLNGVEVARRNLGPAGLFVFHDQPAFQANAAAAAVTLDLGSAASLLRAGNNVLCLQVHNLMSNGADASSFLVQANLSLTGAFSTSLVPLAAPWRFFVGQTEPSAGVVDHGLLREAGDRVLWASPEFNDFAWPHGAGPVGYDTATPADYAVGTNLRSLLYQRATSVYTRLVFTASAAEAAAIDPLALELDYDDGVIVYLNGREVARRNVGRPGTATPHTATATTTHDANGDNGGAATGATETIVLGPAAAWLTDGYNVLAVQLHNDRADGSDLIARVTLRTTGATARTLAAPTDRVRYLAGDRAPYRESAPSAEVPRPDMPETELPDPVIDAGSDWIELRNAGAATADLTGWSLTDNASNPRKWNFPAGTTIPGGGYLLVLATSLDTGPADGATYLHSNFSLGAGGEYLGLVDAGGAVVDALSPAYPPQTPRHSYGRDATGAWVFLSAATPGAANPATGFTALLRAPEATPAAGFHTGAVAVTLNAPDPGGTIRYTLDGSDPTADHGVTYATPVALNTSAVVRAVALRAGAAPSPIATHTYLLNQSAARRQLTAVSLSGDAARVFYGPNAIGGPANGTGVLAIKGGLYLPANTAPTWDANGDPTAYNFAIQRGRAFEKQAALEVFPVTGAGLNTGFGLRLAASDWSRPRMQLSDPVAGPFSPDDGTQKPSFNLYFRSDFGNRPQEFPFIPDNPVTAFEDVRLRAGKNDMVDPFLTDELMRRLYLATGQQSSRGTFVTLYINGVFKGYYNLCERIRDEFMRQHHGGSEDWDVRLQGDIEAGDALAWNRMMAFLQTADLTQLASYAQVHEHLDVENVIDYLLTNAYAATWDWPNNNWAAARERSPAGRWRLYMWDAEGAFGIYGRRAPGTYNIFIGDVDGDGVADAAESGYRLDLGASARTTTGQSVPALYTLLRASPEFRLHWADRVQRHFFHEGALTSGAMEALWVQLRDAVQPIIREVTGVTIDDRIRRDWLVSPVRRTTLFAQMRQYGLWIDTLAPEFSQHGGAITGGTPVAITNPNPTGTIYYTLDGSDPRAPGGAAVGVAYGSPPAITRSQTLKARVLATSGEWSPLQQAAFMVEDTSRLLVTELMYDPPDGNDYEFLELKNVGTGPAYLDGAQFTAGITLTFPAGSMIAPGEHLVVARTPAVFSSRYPGVASLSVGYDGALSNGGERITLTAADGRTLVSVAYSANAPWPAAAAGEGHSLVPVDPNANPAPDDATHWRSSADAGGSPGSDDLEPRVPAAIIGQPQDGIAGAGHRTTLTVHAIGEPAPRFQWQISRDGGVTWEGLVDDGGFTATTAATLRIDTAIADVAGAFFRCIVTNDLAAAVVSSPAQLTVLPPAQLLNLSVRARALPGDGVVIAGLVVRGTSAARLLVRAVGPRLLDYDVAGPLANPRLEVHRHEDADTVLVATNDDWILASDLDALQDAMDEAGAFALGDADTNSSALLLELAPGRYSALARGANEEAGVVLVEVYDLTLGANQLVNLSARASVGRGEDVMIPGFVVQGEAPQRFLIRAVGPGLADHGVTGWLPDPHLVLAPAVGGDDVRNDNWNAASVDDVAELVAMTAEVGAFPLPTNSLDAALLVTLAPGLYTVVVGGADEQTGIALVEIYAVR